MNKGTASPHLMWTGSRNTYNPTTTDNRQIYSNSARRMHHTTIHTRYGVALGQPLICGRNHRLSKRLWRYTSRAVNEAKRPHTCSRPCAFEVRRTKRKKDKTRNLAASKTHHEIYSGPATTTTSRRRDTKHAPRVSPYSPASIDPRFMEVGLVQLSQSVKRHECYTYTD